MADPIRTAAAAVALTPDMAVDSKCSRTAARRVARRAATVAPLPVDRKEAMEVSRLAARQRAAQRKVPERADHQTLAVPRLQVVALEDTVDRKAAAPAVTAAPRVADRRPVATADRPVRQCERLWFAITI